MSIFDLPSSTAVPPSSAASNYNNSTAILIPTLRAAFARVKGGLGNGRIVWIGNSVPFGVGSNGTTSGDCYPLSSPTQFAKMLNAAGINAHSNGRIGGGDPASQNINGNDSRFAFTGSAALLSSPFGLGGGIPAVGPTAGNIAFTPVDPVDNFDTWYYQNPSNISFSLDINGGSATVINSSGTAGIIKVNKAGTLGKNTLNFKYSSGAGQADFAGMEARNSAISSIAVLNAGWPGSNSTQWTDSSAFYSILTALPQFGQDATFIQGSINDWRLGTSLTTFKSNIQLAITAGKAANSGTGDVVLITDPPSNPGFNLAPSLAVQQTFVQALYDLAAFNNIPIIDSFGALVSYAVSNPRGLYTDGLHTSGPGDSEIADATIKVIAPGTGLSISGTVGLSSTIVLTAGVGIINDSRITTTSRAQVQVLSPVGTLGVGYKAICTAGVLTITSYGLSGTTSTLDTSTVQYEIIF